MRKVTQFVFYGPETKSKNFEPGYMIISERLQGPGFHSKPGLFVLGDGSSSTGGATGFKQVVYKGREIEEVPSLRQYSAEVAPCGGAAHFLFSTTWTCSCTSWSVMYCLFTSLFVLSELNGWIPFMFHDGDDKLWGF